MTFDNIQEEFSHIHKEEKVINDMLATLPKSGVSVEINDIQRVADQLQHTFNANFQMLQDFVAAVKQDCVMDKFYFNFMYIPDLIVRRQCNRKDYELILKVLNKVKGSYIESKVEKQMLEKLADQYAKRKNKDGDDDMEEEMEIMKSQNNQQQQDEDKGLSAMQLTDDDLVPLELFDGVLSEY